MNIKRSSNTNSTRGHHSQTGAQPTLFSLALPNATKPLISHGLTPTFKDIRSSQKVKTGYRQMGQRTDSFLDIAVWYDKVIRRENGLVTIQIQDFEERFVYLRLFWALGRPTRVDPGPTCIMRDPTASVANVAGRCSSAASTHTTRSARPEVSKQSRF